MRTIPIRVGSTGNQHCAWVDEPGGAVTRITTDDRDGHYTALGKLLMHLSIDEDLERTGVDIELVDTVPEDLADRKARS